MKIFAATKHHQFEFESNYENNEIIITAEKDQIKYDLVSLGEGRYSLIKDHQSYFLRFVKTDGKYHVHLFGEHYVIDVEDERSRKLRELTKVAETGPQIQEIKAPIPGLVFKILIAEARTVKSGDQLLVLEAMKMENVIKADCDCFVEKIHVKEKETVQLNQILLTLRKAQSR